MLAALSRLATFLVVLAALALVAEATRGRTTSWREDVIRRRSVLAIQKHHEKLGVDYKPQSKSPFKPGTGKSKHDEMVKRRELKAVKSATMGWKDTTCFAEPMLEEEFLGLYLDPDGDPVAGGGPAGCLVEEGVPIGTIDPAKCKRAHESFGKYEVDWDKPGYPATGKESCCMFDACVLPCPEKLKEPHKGFLATIVVFMVIFCLIGIGTIYFIKGDAQNFFVAGRSLPLWVVTMTLASQSIDSNALLGNADLAHYYNFWDGAVLPIGLGLSLILNGIFLARKINEENVMTLPDVFAQRFGKVPEIAASVCLITSFLMLLAGNLVGMGAILQYISPDIDASQGVWVAALITLVYTACGGLYSVAYTDCIQSVIGWTGCLVTAFWIIHNMRNDDYQVSVQPTMTDGAPPLSIGFGPPFGYAYPDKKGDGGACDLYDGVPCQNWQNDTCCYNADKWLNEGSANFSGTVRIDNGAYPVGDAHPVKDYMTKPDAYSPFPNAILFNWATIFVLGFGNLAALDFQARCMAAKTPNVAVIGCIIAGLLTFVVGIPWAYVGGVTRYMYGPDSIFAEFEPDSCNKLLMLPTCALWVPDNLATIKLLTHDVPQFIGGWALIGIVAASMSTSDGAILAMGTVLSHNIARHFSPMTDAQLLNVSRAATVPFAFIGAIIAAYAKINHSAGTGYLLIVAFDIALASCVVSLFAAFYTSKPSATAATMSIIGGALLRLILEFALKKDGYLIAPWKGDEFLNLAGPGGVNSYVPGFTDMPELLRWNGTHVGDAESAGIAFGIDKDGESQCKAERYEDWTGLDSLVSPVFGLLLYVIFHALDNYAGVRIGGAWMQPYKKFDDTGHVQIDDAEPKGEAETEMVKGTVV